MCNWQVIKYFYSVNKTFVDRKKHQHQWNTLILTLIIIVLNTGGKGWKSFYCWAKWLSSLPPSLVNLTIYMCRVVLALIARYSEVKFITLFSLKWDSELTFNLGNTKLILQCFFKMSYKLIMCYLWIINMYRYILKLEPYVCVYTHVVSLPRKKSNIVLALILKKKLKVDIYIWYRYTYIWCLEKSGHEQELHTETVKHKQYKTKAEKLKCF